MPTISIAEPVQINAIIWITSLIEAERGASRRMFEAIEDQHLGGSFPVVQRIVETRADLFALFGDLAADAEGGLRPILHFDMHGSAEGGIALNPSGERVTWPEILEELRAMNLATHNNLVVVFALCHGLNLYRFVELAKPVPAYLFAAPEKRVNLGFLLDEVPAFYQQVHQSHAFLGAFNATLGKEMKLYHCQGLFLEALARYVRDHCAGAELEAGANRVAYRRLDRNGIVHPSLEQLQQARGRARADLTPGPHIIDHYAPIFLIGRQPGFTFADVEAVAWSSRSS